MEQYTLLNTLKVTYPANLSVGLSLLYNESETELASMPTWATGALFTVGCATAGTIAYLISKGTLSSMYRWYKTVGNAKERLAIAPNPRRKNQKVYVVVYGTKNHASRAFCTYLAEHGYSLILIDNDQNSLNSAEKYILKDFPEVSIMKVKMEEFDEGEILRIVKQLNKFGEVIRGLVLTKNVMLNEDNSKKFEGLTYDEIHIIFHDNSEMMIGLTNVLLKPIKKAGNGFIINLRNVKYEDEADAIYWDLLHHSTTSFSLTFMDAIRRTEEGKDKGKFYELPGKSLILFKFLKNLTGNSLIEKYPFPHFFLNWLINCYRK